MQLELVLTIKKTNKVKVRAFKTLSWGFQTSGVNNSILTKKYGTYIYMYLK